MSGIFSRGQQLSAIFAPGNSGIVTGILNQGVDIGSQFAAYASGAQAAATGLLAHGTDISQLFQALAATPPYPVVVGLSTGLVSGSGPVGTITTPSVTATPSGGTGAFSGVSWTRTGGSASIVATAPNSSTTAFQVASATGSYSAQFVCTATDTAGHSGTSGIVNVTIQALTLTATITPTNGYAETVRPTIGSTGSTSINFTANASQASGAVSYAWSLTRNPGNAVLGNPTAPTCYVQKTGNLFDVEGDIQCIVTDSLASVTPTATFELVRSSNT